MSVVILSLVFAASFGGCGSGSDEASREQTALPDETTSGARPAENPGTARTQDAERNRSPEGTSGQGGDEAETERQAGVEGQVTGHELAKICPRGLKRAECKSVAEDLAEPSPSHTMEDPRDCLAVMSRDQCEALAEAVTGTSTGSVNVEECVRNPTPHCEEVLGPVLEAMYEAHRAGK